MRLLNAQTKELAEFLGANIPPYAILSHTWGKNELSLRELELLYRDSLSNTSSAAAVHSVPPQSVRKIEGCCEQALRDGLDWVDMDRHLLYR